MKAKTYHEWFLFHQKELTAELSAQKQEPGAELTTGVVRYSHLKNYILSGEEKPDILVACDDDGELSEYALRMIRDFFALHPRVNMVYGDEDQISGGAHVSPWFKADWSPDTFLSTFYFGSIFAIRSSVLALLNPGERTAPEFESESSILDQADGGFSRRRGEEMPIGHIPEILFHATHKPEAWDANLLRESLTGRFSQESATTRLISIIIPSKDNPEILEQCVRSVIEYARVPYEIIIVDNGSNAENRERIQRFVDEINEGDLTAIYLYKEMPFNMARLNNIGAACANGEMLLFLHDDVMIRKSGWLSHLSEKAKLPYVGAVGMKLLYPSSNIIQHAGIFSVGGEPVYKLQYRSNEEVWYYGFNKGVRNVLAISGACVMIRREVFLEVGGFDEANFPNCFTNVDFCYRVYEKGYYNVVRNNMYLYYYDPVSKENLETLEEREKLRPVELESLKKLHPLRTQTDPFYHPYLTQDVKETKFVPSLETGEEE